MECAERKGDGYKQSGTRTHRYYLLVSIKKKKKKKCNNAYSSVVESLMSPSSPGPKPSVQEERNGGKIIAAGRPGDTEDD